MNGRPSSWDRDSFKKEMSIRNYFAILLNNHKNNMDHRFNCACEFIGKSVVIK